MKSVSEIFENNEYGELVNKIEPFIRSTIYGHIFPKGHDSTHFTRVSIFGFVLCRYNEAKGITVDKQVVIWFAYLHDICRRIYGYKDEEHGERAAQYVKMIRNTWLRELSDYQIYLLSEAVKWHNKITRYNEITIDTCFDADRLDLPRFEITVNPSLLATNEAKRLFLKYHGNYQNYLCTFALELTRLKFNDYYFDVIRDTKVGARIMIEKDGFYSGPFSPVLWDINKKSVELIYNNPCSGIYVYDYPCIPELLVTYKRAKDNSELNNWQFIVLLLEYDETMVIRRINNTFAKEYNDETILSKANIMGTCVWTDNIESDVNKVIDHYKKKHLPILP